MVYKCETKRSWFEEKVITMHTLITSGFQCLTMAHGAFPSVYPSLEGKNRKESPKTQENKLFFETGDLRLAWWNVVFARWSVKKRKMNPFFYIHFFRMSRKTRYRICKTNYSQVQTKGSEIQFQTLVPILNTNSTTFNHLKNFHCIQKA